MMRFVRLVPGILLPLALLAGGAVLAQQALIEGDVGQTRAELARARQQLEIARDRAERLEVRAQRVTEKVEKTAQEAAAVAARIQETEAQIAEQEARIALITKARVSLRERLAARQRPVVRLTAALQRLSRRPPALALLRPGSVRDTMHMRALLETMIPEVERRTAALKVEIERGRELERLADTATRDLRKSEAELKGRRERLAAIETRQRLESRQASGIADREADRALALAEQARDLGVLIEQLDKAGALRAELARLPGPIMRPPRPEESEVVMAEAFTVPPQGLTAYVLPVAGKVVTGFGEAVDGGPRSRGVTFSTRAGAQVIAPAPGRVAFAGPYRGYDSIVIIEHDGGWTTLVTGLVQLNARVGDTLVSGSPLGTAGPVDPVVTVELREDGEPVNPLQYIRSL
ncbi:MAG: peptidoglycan DD-metalloendopeptidase family protein [Novosphingobium sp.]|nr:peptidoglycan DD-metalloendopeptidase family protein [Novosphingobium sp.]